MCFVVCAWWEVNMSCQEPVSPARRLQHQQQQQQHHSTRLAPPPPAPAPPPWAASSSWGSRSPSAGTRSARRSPRTPLRAAPPPSSPWGCCLGRERRRGGALGWRRARAPRRPAPLSHLPRSRGPTAPCRPTVVARLLSWRIERGSLRAGPATPTGPWPRVPVFRRGGVARQWVQDRHIQAKGGKHMEGHRRCSVLCCAVLLRRAVPTCRR